MRAGSHNDHKTHSRPAGTGLGCERNTALLFGRIGTGSADMLCGLKEFRRDNLQVQQHLGSAIAAAEYAGIGEVADDTPDAGVVPHLTRSCPVACLFK